MNLHSRSLIPSIDSTIDVPVEKDKAVDDALAFYKNIPGHIWKFAIPKDVWHPRILPSLSPVQIDQVVQRIIAEMPEEHILNKMTGVYLTQLIQKSYNSGNNGFMIHTQNVPLETLGYSFKGCVASDYFLTGPEATPLHLTIYGDTGANTLSESIGVDLVVYGCLGADYLHNARSCRATIFGTPKNISEAFRHVTLKMTDEEIFNKYKQNWYKQTFSRRVPAQGRRFDKNSNKFILIDDAGKELEAFEQ